MENLDRTEPEPELTEQGTLKKNYKLETDTVTIPSNSFMLLCQI